MFIIVSASQTLHFHAKVFQILIVQPDKHITVNVATPTECQLLAWSGPSPARKDPFSQELLWKALLQDGCSVAVNCMVGRLSKGGLAGTALA